MLFKNPSLLVIFGAILCSVVFVRASDWYAAPGVVECPLGMQKVQSVNALVCIDRYETSPGPTCPQHTIESTVATDENLSVGACVPESKAGAVPWRFVTYIQAQQLCARAGKRLPTAAEWYQAALATDVTACEDEVIKEPYASGERKCVTTQNINDLVGNVWEWVADTSVDGVFNNRTLPPEGYVTAVDPSGVVTQTSTVPDSNFDNDYAWTVPQGAVGIFGMIRGGYFGGGSDAGIFSQHNGVPLSFATHGVGFRCVQDL